MNFLRRSNPHSTLFLRQAATPAAKSWSWMRWDMPWCPYTEKILSPAVTVCLLFVVLCQLCYKQVLSSSLDWTLFASSPWKLCQQLIGNDVLLSNERLVRWNMVSNYSNYSITLNKCNLCRALSFFSKPSPKIRRSNRRTTMFSPSLRGL